MDDAGWRRGNQGQFPGPWWPMVWQIGKGRFLVADWQIRQGSKEDCNRNCEADGLVLWRESRWRQRVVLREHERSNGRGWQTQALQANARCEKTGRACDETGARGLAGRPGCEMG